MMKLNKQQYATSAVLLVALTAVYLSFRGSDTLSCDNSDVADRILEMERESFDRNKVLFNSIPLLGQLHIKYITHSNVKMLSVAELGGEDQTKNCQLKILLYLDSSEISRLKAAIENEQALSEILEVGSSIDPNGTKILNSLYGDGIVIVVKYNVFVNADGDVEFETTEKRIADD